MDELHKLIAHELEAWEKARNSAFVPAPTPASMAKKVVAAVQDHINSQQRETKVHVSDPRRM